MKSSEFLRRMMKHYYVHIFSLAAVVFLATLLACEIDHGLKPTVYMIKGKIFLLGKAPENTEFIEVIVASDFPPKEFMALERSGPLPFDKDTVEYEVRVSRGTYAAVGLLWKGYNLPWSVADIMGIYSTWETFPMPTPVTLTEDQPIAENINFYADWSLVTRDAVIEGTITYVGTWPEDTEIVALAAYPREPETDIEYITLLGGFDLSLPLFVSSSRYRLSVRHGTYGYIVLFWKRLGTAITDFEALGFYADPQNPDKPGKITLTKGDTLRNIDIIADFNQLPPGQLE